MRLLVVSNNALSFTNNNGKTIESFLKFFSEEEICQLFFSNEFPQSTACKKFIRINEKDILNSIFNKKECYKCVEGNMSLDIEPNNLEKISKIKDMLKKSNLLRLLREGVWKTGVWRTKGFRKWIREYNPTHVFFCAGDSLFAYDVVNFIKKNSNSKLMVYFTDDYYFRRHSINIFGELRQNLIKRNIRGIISKADMLITISDHMRREYFKEFGKDSIHIANMVPSLRIPNVSQERKKHLVFVYAGSLYYGRDKMLFNIANVVEEFNRHNDKKHKIQIYSRDCVKYMNQKLPNCIQLKDAVEWNKLVEIYNNADVLLFVESFEKKFIEKTKFSFSTKIPEYLSLEKCILAYGPSEVGSMRFLSDCACCVNSKKELSSAIEKIVKSFETRDLIAKKCLEKYEEYCETNNPSYIYNKITSL